MPFVFEYITTGSPVEQTPEYQQAVALKRGLPIGSRVIDSSQGATLYCLSEGGTEDRPPGDYLLFYKGQITKIRAYLKIQWVDGLGDVATYRIYSLDIPPAIQTDRDNVVQVMTEALEAKVRSYPVPPTTVKIEFM